MADIGRLEFKAFDLGLALKGAKLAWAKTTSGVWDNSLGAVVPPDIGASGTDNVYTYSNLGSIVENFRKSDISNNSAKEYMADVNNIVYYFNYDGYCSDNDPMHRIYILDAYIPPSEGTVMTRGDSLEPVNIASLQPREHFAQTAMLGILNNTPNPLSLTKANVTDIVEKAFEIANAMMQKAANVRRMAEASSGGGNADRDEEVEVKPEELTENRDKLLYNLNENLFKVVDQISSNDKGVRIKPTNDAQFKVANVAGTVLEAKVTNTVDTNIKSTSIDVPVDIQNNPVPISGNVSVSGAVDANVTNMLTEPVYVSVRNTPDVRVTNMPSVPSEPVSITGTVSVDNFPSSDSGSETT